MKNRKSLLLFMLLFFLIPLPVYGQQQLIYLPLIFKGGTMPNFPEPILQFISADGKVLDLLNRSSGIEMEDPYWRPNIAQYKDGGQFVNSSIADGRRLVVTNYDNVTETIPLSVHGKDQAAAVKTLRELLQLGRQAADYWAKPYEYDPVWVAVRPACNDCRLGYVRLVKASIAELPPVFSQPFFSAQPEAVLEDITLVIEREPLWRGVPPGEVIGPLYNLIKNPDFELWNFGVTDSQPDSWTDLESAGITGTNNQDSDAHSGERSLKIRVSQSTATNRFKGVSQVISGTRANTTYTVLAWVRNDGVSNGVGRILVTYSSQLEIYRSSSKHGWTLYSGTFTTGAADTVAISLEILTTAANTDGTIYVDSLMLLEGDWEQEAIDGVLPYMTSSHIVNHWDQVGSTLVEAGDLNYVDMWNIPGDESALVRLEMVNNTPDSSINSPVVFQTIRAGLRRARDVTQFTNFYDPPGVADTTASGDDRINSGTLSTAWTTVGYFTINDPAIIQDNLGRFRVLARVWDTSTSGALNLEVRLRYWIGQAGTNVKTLDSVTVPGRGSWYIADLTGNTALNWDIKSKNLPGSLGFEIQMRRATGTDQGRLDYALIVPTDGGILFANVSPSVPLDSGLVVDNTNSSDVYGARLPRGWREVFKTTDTGDQKYLEDFNGALYMTGIAANGNTRLFKFQNNGGTFLYEYTGAPGEVPLEVYNNKLYSFVLGTPSQAYASDGTTFPGSAAFTFGNLILPRMALSFCGKLYIAGESNASSRGVLYEWDGSAGTATLRFTSTNATSRFLALYPYQNKLYIAESAGGATIRVYEFNTTTFVATQSFSVAATPTYNAVNFIEFQGKLYLAAGTSALYRFDGSSWTTITPLTSAARWHGLAVSGDRLFVAGFNNTTSQAYVISTTDGSTWQLEYTPGETSIERGISMAVSQGQIFMGTFVSSGSATLHATVLTENQYKVADYQLSEFRAPNREWGNPKRHRYFFSYDRENGVNVADDAMLVGIGVVPQFLSLVGNGAD